MAKAPRATVTRLAVTVNARYYPTEGIGDAYCLAGRFPGRREQRAVDTTLERENRGFLISVFGYPKPDGDDDAPWRASLSRLSAQMEADDSNIDNDLNDLAETTMDVTGRTMLSASGEREPYFAGYLLRDGELAAVTLGDGVAMLYRRGMLYPLTDDRLELEAVDSAGHAVQGLHDFIAGEAGTLRYSNIAQIETGDLLIICNRTVFSAVGQAEWLRILSEAEDQNDACGLLLTAAAAKMPGEPLQIAIGRIEEQIAEERPSRLNLGRFATQAMTPIKGGEEIPSAEEKDEVDLARTQRYHRRDMEDYLAAQAASTADGPAPAEPEAEIPASPARPEAPDEAEAHRAYRRETADDAVADDAFAHMPGHTSQTYAEYGDVYEDDAYRSEAADAYAAPSEADYYSKATASARNAWEASYADEDDDAVSTAYEDEYDVSDEEAAYERSARNKKLIFYVILIVIIALCIFALIKMLAGGNKKPSTTVPATTVPKTTIGMVQPPIQPKTTAAPAAPVTTPPESDPAVTEPAPPAGDDKVIQIADNDTPYSLCIEHYGRWTEALSDALMRYNGKEPTDAIYVGEDFKIPPIEKLTDND